jgi:hypothetical protein
MASQYHSVEIVIETRSSTEALVAALLPGAVRSDPLSPTVEVLGNEAGDATITRIQYEDSALTKLVVCPSPNDAREADARIRQLCEELNNLPEAARREWDQADLREFFVGYDVSGIGFSYSDRFSQDAVSATAALRAAIGVAIYSGRND